MWNIIFDKIPTRKNLLKRSFHGPFRCHLCCCEEESIDHLFIHCTVSRDFWHSISSYITSLKAWQGTNSLEAWNNWTREHSGKPINMPLLVCWAIWIARNQIIFNNKDPHWPTILSHTIADYNMLPEIDHTAPTHTFSPITIDKSKP